MDFDNIYQQKIIPMDIVDSCISDYNNRTLYETVSMNKAIPGDSLKLVHNICEELFGKKLDYKIGNFYKHKIPYYPHTDYRTELDNTINVVIPLWYTGSLPHLVVFDQIWEKDSVTWCLKDPVIKFELNTGVPGCPHEYEEVKNLTNKPIEDNFYNNYLTHKDKSCYFGMSGQAFAFDPGSIIIFNNKRIHCTSNFIGEKLGLSIRFKIQ